MRIAVAEDVTREPVEVAGGETAGGETAAAPRRTIVPGVARVAGPQPYRSASWASRSEPTVVRLPTGTRIGGREVVVIAGLSAAGPEARVVEAAHRLRAAGAAVLHGGTLRPPRSPYARAGRAGDALRALARAREETGMAIAAEAADLKSALLLADHVDVLQVGAGNMQDYPLLSGVARLGKPVLLVRGRAATLTELLLAAEYVLAAGNGDVILCEAGVLGLSPDGRDLLDLAAVPVLQSLTHLPVVVAPGADAAMACAAIAAGADGLVLEPGAGDGIAPAIERARRVAAAMGRRLG
jgi:3-deoxy-7-phosphoheptulonate synthase